MKFTKEQVKENILAKLGNTRKLSDRSIDEMIASAIVFAGEETEIADFLKNAEPMFVTANSNLIKEQADFVKDWETKNPKPPTPATPPVPPITNGLTAEDVARIVSETMKPIAETLNGIKKKETTVNLLASAKEKFLTERNPDMSNEVVVKILSRVESNLRTVVTEESSVDQLASAFKSEFDDLADLTGISTPYIPAEPGASAGGVKVGSAEYYASEKERLKKQGLIS